ncbi:hypothetical protein LZ31DRAFT_485437 [Colletotrichum somersetense]|nr:hypothetical protein LZ31DRAFT_485437 [Colletotrichum somersetense]
MELPPGVLESDSQVSRVIATVSAVLSVTFLTVALRTYTRVCIVRQVGMDDVCAIITLFIVFGCGFAVAWNVRNGLGRHVYFLAPEEIKNYFKAFYTSIVLYNASLGGIKMTFLLQYYRVLAVQKMKKVIIGAMVIAGAWSTSQIFVTIFTCSPVAAFWDRSIKGTCIPNDANWYSNAAGNITTDIMVLVLPLPLIRSLKLRRGQKCVLLGIFCLGFFTCAISIVRIKFLHLEEDFTWMNVESSTWSIIELCSGLTCACLPACRPLVSRFIPALGTRSAKTSTYRLNDSSTFKKTGGTLQQRDPELGGSVNRSRHLAPNQNRRTESADSKAELYDTGAHNTRQENWSSNGSLLIQVPEGLEHRSSKKERISLPVWRRFHSEEGLETRIEAREGSPEDELRLQPDNSIEITHDIVQISSPRVDKKEFA